MKKSPRISVLMPAYNSAKYVAEAIESILNQTFTDFEFIIINDGSTDDTARVVREYAARDPRIKFIDNQKNQGLIAVLNQGLDLCTGEYIARMDSDDISLPMRFEKQIKYMDANPDVGILGTAGQNFGANNDVNYSPEIVDAVELLRGVGFYHPSVMMRRAVLDKYGLRYDSNYYLVEDHELWSRALHVTKLRNLPEVLIKYRVHSNSVSVSNSALQESNKGIVRNNILNVISNDAGIRQQILALAGQTPIYDVKSVRLFNVLPIIRITRKAADNIRVYLFHVLPILKIKRNKIYLFHFMCIGRVRSCRKDMLDSHDFKPFDIDSTAVLSELQKLPLFTYIPNSGNLGDMLIAKATLDFFGANNIRYKMFSDVPDDVLVYGGGGQWTSDYKQHWLKWLDLFKQASRIVILPSSFNNCPELIDVLDERFVVFCREQKSYDYLMSAGTKAKIILDHDMALRMTKQALRGRVRVYGRSNRRALDSVKNAIEFPRTVIKLMRTDCESACGYDTDLDLSAVRYGAATSSAHHIDFCAKLMLMAVDCADAIITDRLHVGIAAALMGKEVYLLDNTYGKLSGVYQHSLKSNPHIHFCDTMPDVNKLRPMPTNKNNFKVLMGL